MDAIDQSSRMDAYRDAYRQLSDSQQKLLSILPIPSAILSIVGSFAIIDIARQRRKGVQQWTPYNRLLVAMSICDIVLSLNFASAAFLRPAETSSRIWARGNDGTCTFSAFVTQVATATMWYQGMLSIYFLLTARYGIKNAVIAKRVEPWMHLVALGYPISTAIAGVGMGIYGERVGEGGCTVIRYEDTSTSEAWVVERSNAREAMLYIFYGVPLFMATLCLTFTQLSIFMFIRRHRKSPSSEDSTSKGSNSSENNGRTQRPKTPSAKQSHRQQLVCSQAFLFVMAFVLCHLGNLLMAGLQSSSRTRADEMEILVKYYPVVVLQAVLLPSQGSFNFLIYCRPKYLMLRFEFPDESRLWALRRVFLGDELRPTSGANNTIGEKADYPAANRQKAPESDEGTPISGSQETYKSIPLRLSRDMVSSLTLADFDDDDDSADDAAERGQRWHNAGPRVKESSPAFLASRVNRLTTLEAISEIEETVFGLNPYQTNGSHLPAASVALSTPIESSENRWKGTESTSTPMTPRGYSSSFRSIESFSGTDPRHRSAASDIPIQAPKRMDSPMSIPRRMGSPMSVPKRMDSPIHVPRRMESPIHVAKRIVEAPMGSSISGLSSDSRALDYSETQKNLTSWHIGAPEKKKIDTALVPPRRFVSLPPSEIEDEAKSISS
ncbi:unnamed protein product [Cylindrotheca closterium]|uniref:G-protein coupled receptors family 1 profile domain-containing protein n=1 Tax=Cylindrotheca closterium TaxID=2856 RepID=A0AAD2CXZ2_9STRA|nr:unnamed protein product [Cylindrotheca closterium]